ncbi:transcriptional regulator [Streptomyces sp. TRM76323]|uniref:Transcriptional regulator n=1 Tax=Streptomyces tamarix TaxID=3078565 RepID=A0ABU3QPB7_9ACTN|nr:transcriptional regulator [Streptomyces tamarix]MDT9684606.1 transcriptional regulator [Streptomyces tamarix]
MAVAPRAGREANERLRAVMEEAGCSNTGLARRVNTCGAEHGLDLRYDKTSVARWLRGQQPRGRAPAIIAEALERKLGRTVTVDDIGMSTGPGLAPTVGLRFEPTVAGALQQACALWRSDTKYSGLVTRERLATSVLVQASRDWLIAEPDPSVAVKGVPAVGPADIEVVRATTAALTDLDHSFGSGHIRPVAVRYLDSVVSGLLAGPYRESTGRLLLGAVARLTELTAYMTVDTGQLGLAQRYYIQALRLAQAADDRVFGGYVLASGMGHVALLLDNPGETVQLAKVAREGTQRRTTATSRAVFYAAEARGHALLGDAGACEKAADQVLEALNGDGPDAHERQEGIPHVDRAYLAQELAHCYQDLGRPEAAVRWAQEALREGAPKARRRALRLLLLASVELQLGEVERSCGTAAQAVEVLGGVRSVQCARRLEAFRGRLEALGRHEEAHRLRPADEH